MSIYNEYYKRYYADVKSSNGIKLKSRSPQYTPRNGRSNTDNSGEDQFTLNIFSRNYVTNFTVQASVAIILIMGIAAAKVYPDSMFKEIYDKGVYYMEKGTITPEMFKNEQVVSVFNQIKDFVAVDDKKEKFIMENYKLPVDLKSVTNIDFTEDRVTMTLKNDSYIRSAYGGIAKEVSEGGDTAVLINHGNGVEIMYIGMDKLQVTKDTQVNPGDILGCVSGVSGNKVTIEVFYMGSRLRPERCFNMSV